MLTLLSIAAALTMDQPVHFDECSHHSAQSEIRIGSTLLSAYGLEWKTSTYYGSCIAYQVLDFRTDRFLTTDPYGLDCPAGPPTMLTPHVFDKASPEFESLLAEWIETLDRVAAGYACHPPKPELTPVIAYLQQLKETNAMRF